MNEVYRLADKLTDELQELYKLPYTVRTEDKDTFIYDVENEAGLKLRVNVARGKYLLLEVVTFGFLYGYEENKTYLRGLVKVGKGDTILVNMDTSWNVISAGMSELTKDKRYMATHKQFKTTNMKKHFCGQYLDVSNEETFGYYDEYFGETPLYLEAVTEWDVTDYLQTTGSLTDFVEDVKCLLDLVWGN